MGKQKQNQQSKSVKENVRLMQGHLERGEIDAQQMANFIRRLNQTGR